MTTTDPAITIVGMRAEIDALTSALRSSNAALASASTSAACRDATLARCDTERDALAAALATCTAERDEAVSALAHATAKHSEELTRVEMERDDSIKALREAARKGLDSALANLRACEARVAAIEKESDKAAARVKELESRPVLTDEVLSAALDVAGLPGGHAPWIIAKLGAVTLPSPTTPPAEVFAGVSVEELHTEYNAGHARCKCDTETPPASYCCEQAGIRAVLARLKVSLVAPVDPVVVEGDRYNRQQRSSEAWLFLDDDVKNERTASMRAALIAAGVPVTPERGFQFSDIRLPARLVPAAEADRDPATRGPLPGGEG